MTAKILPPVQRWWDWTAALLLIVATITASTRLAATRWTNHLEIIQTIAFMGVILGLALGQTRFSPRLALYLALAYGLFALPWQFGNLLEGELAWGERLSVIGDRLGLVISQIINRQAVQDSILFLVLMGTLFWVLSVHAGYTLTRHGQAWLAFLPMGLAMFVIHSFDAIIPRRAWYLAAYLFFGLVLVARMAYRQKHIVWQKNRTVLPPQLSFDFIRFGLIAVTVVILLSWTVPAMANAMPGLARAIDPLRQQWYEIRDRMDNAFASLRATVGVASDYYGSNVTLGRGNRLTDTQVFLVRPPQEVPPGIRYYWRARTYDQYSNGQWLSSLTQSEEYTPDEETFAFSIQSARWQGYFEFITAANQTTVFSAPQPLWYSTPGTVHLVKNPDNTVELASVRASPSLEAGTLYATEASLSDASILEMRQSGDDYPEYIREYLQLPNTITERTYQLAQELTAGMDNPYDKVMAVTNYLRDNITYQETIPEVPVGKEPVDWFLFEYKKGFCNYYATAEAVLLRAAGIPARWSVGYAQGEKLEDGNYLVRQRDAHAWPEIYFAGLGWVEFEPTVSQPSIERLAEPIVQEVVGPSTPEPAVNDNETRRDLLEELRNRQGEAATPIENQAGLPVGLKIVLWVIPILLAGGLLFAAWRLRDRIPTERIPLTLEAAFRRVGIKPPPFIRRWAYRVSLSPLSRAYLEINAALRRLGKHPAITDTPAERTANLSRTLPPAQEPAERLLHEYQVATFSPNPADEIAAQQAGAEIRSLSWKALFRKWFSKLQEPEKLARKASGD